MTRFGRLLLAIFILTDTLRNIISWQVQNEEREVYMDETLGKESKFMAMRVHIAVGASNYLFRRDIVLLTYFHALLDPVAVD
jgi:hypothetical protein